MELINKKDLTNILQSEISQCKRENEMEDMGEDDELPCLDISYMAYQEGYFAGLNHTRDMINTVQAIDTAKVVHCKDCKYWRYYGNGYHFCDIFLIAKEYDADSYDSYPDDFCSKGVMRDETN